MAFNGSGVFSRLFNWVVDRDSNVPITASRMDSEMDGFATGLTTAICKDGQSTTTAAIPFAARIRAAGGTLALPTISGITDTDTGFCFDLSANTIHVVCSASVVTTFGALGFKVGFTTRDLTAASGDQSITGVGFQPRAVLLFGSLGGTTSYSFGFGAVGITQAQMWHTSALGMNQANTSIALIQTSSTPDRQLATLASMDADGFTLTWTKSNSPTGTADLFYLAIR